MNVSDPASEICCHARTPTNTKQSAYFPSFCSSPRTPRSRAVGRFINSSLGVGGKAGSRREEEKRAGNKRRKERQSKRGRKEVKEEDGMRSDRGGSEGGREGAMRG